jgi:hypothetical protein
VHIQKVVRNRKRKGRKGGMEGGRKEGRRERKKVVFTTLRITPGY